MPLRQSLQAVLGLDAEFNTSEGWFTNNMPILHGQTFLPPKWGMSTKEAQAAFDGLSEADSRAAGDGMLPVDACNLTHAFEVPFADL